MSFSPSSPITERDTSIKPGDTEDSQNLSAKIFTERVEDKQSQTNSALAFNDQPTAGQRRADQPKANQPKTEIPNREKHIANIADLCKDGKLDLAMAKINPVITATFQLAAGKDNNVDAGRKAVEKTVEDINTALQKKGSNISFILGDNKALNDALQKGSNFSRLLYSKSVIVKEGEQETDKHVDIVVFDFKPRKK